MGTHALTEKLRRDERIKRYKEVMRNQVEMVGALDRVMGGFWPVSDDFADRALALRVQVARELVITCEAIWTESGPEGVAR